MRNHPMVRLVQAPPATGSCLRLDVGNQSAFLGNEEAIRLFADLSRLLVLRGLIPAQEPLDA